MTINDISNTSDTRPVYSWEKDLNDPDRLKAMAKQIAGLVNDLHSRRVTDLILLLLEQIADMADYDPQKDKPAHRACGDIWELAVGLQYQIIREMNIVDEFAGAYIKQLKKHPVIYPDASTDAVFIAAFNDSQIIRITDAMLSEVQERRGRR